MEPNVQYLPDRDVDEAMDRALRDLLTNCFTKKQDVVFKYRRYFIDPYPHRWIIRENDGKLVAHAGVHEKCAVAADQIYRVGGIAEVCVHPGWRGRGHVRRMLSEIHDFLIEREFDFSILFGDHKVYGSSGYRPVSNLFMAEKPSASPNERKAVTGLIRELSNRAWPETEVVLLGKKF